MKRLPVYDRVYMGWWWVLQSYYEWIDLMVFNNITTEEFFQHLLIDIVDVIETSYYE